MYKKKNILAVVMARGGSKGIKNKNLKRVNSKSLVAIAGLFLKKIKMIDESIISATQKKLQMREKKFSQTVFLETKNISGDRVSDFQVINHSLKYMEKKRKRNFI